MTFSLNDAQDDKTAPAIALSPDIEADTLRRRLAAEGRVQIARILTEEAAHAVADCLEHETPWSYTFFDDQAARIVEPQEFARLSRQDRERTRQFLLQQARTGFSYSYWLYPMQEAEREGRDPGLLLHTMLRFVNGSDMIGLIRRLLGDDSVVRADAQATRFGPLNYLTRHDDDVPEDHRRCAYVFNFTRHWRADWGGYLQFFDPAGDGEVGVPPRFNTLTLFTVPQSHAVLPVAPFAGGFRYAISGWFRAEA